jgi:hypothetical protein
MKVSEQIDAIASLGADPVKKLIWRDSPRRRSPAAAVRVRQRARSGGGALIADSIFDVPAGYFYETYVDELYPMDYIWAGEGDDLRQVDRHHRLLSGLQTSSAPRRRHLDDQHGRGDLGHHHHQDFVLTMIFLPVG